MEGGVKKNPRYAGDNKFKVWVCKWLHSSVANPHDLAVVQVKAKTLSPVCWFIISKENRLQTSRHWLFWSGICLGNCSCSLGPWLCPWDSSGCRIGPLYVLWLQMMLWSPVNWTKPLPTPFCFLVTNSHCKKVSTCVMAKAKAVPKCFSCKILECCLQCQWVSVKSFGVGSLSSFCRISLGKFGFKSHG